MTNYNGILYLPTSKLLLSRGSPGIYLYTQNGVVAKINDTVAADPEVFLKYLIEKYNIFSEFIHLNNIQLPLYREDFEILIGD